MTDLLITGSNGFLGSEIVRQAVTAGVKVRSTGRADDVSSYFGQEYCRADILDPITLKLVFDGVNSVIHAAGLAHIFDQSQAAKSPFREVNEIGTVNVARAAACVGVRHFVLVSSVSVYGGIATGIDETTVCHPEGFYAESKWQAEQRAIEIAKATGMSLTILRLATLYGEGDPGNVARLMRTIDSGRFFWVGNGANRKSLLYKGDAARAALAAVQHSASGINIYNVSAPPCTMGEIVEGLADALGKRPLPVRMRASVAVAATQMLSALPSMRFSGLHTTVEKWLAEDVYDTRRIEDTIGFHTQVSLADGLQREVQWYRNHQAK